MIDEITKQWIRNAADERAAERGARFNLDRANHPIKFAEKYLRLYEGEWAGEPFVPHDWQVETTQRMFGWEVWSTRWNRWVRRFRNAWIFIPKKNKKSPSLAWWGLYLLSADGEQGQKVFLGAKDGQQAREIAGMHAVTMCETSPALMAQCKINRSTMQITHVPTRSILKPISSSDSRRQQAKEGINGSILIDETHVVDREFISRISRAGISRMEPFVIGVSTAGNDPEGFGKEIFDYGQRINEGKEDNDTTLFVSYGAPQDLSDGDLAADPIKWGRIANPAMGHTVDEKEFLDDYHQSCRSISALADFKMYRLNIWQSSANPWLPAGMWDQCFEPYREEDLLGQVCYGGLDLARTRDTSALFLVFPQEGGTFRLLCYHWLPERRAQELRADVRYLEWSSQGWVTLTPGDVSDYGVIEHDFDAILQKFDLRMLEFDDHYAAQLVQRLVMNHGMGSDAQEAFSQTIGNFTGPMALFERLVRQGKIKHNGNPVLSWQMGNVMVKTDVNQNMRPVKQPYGDKRTIDGPVAGIMALAAADKYGDAMSTGGVEAW